MRRPIRNLLLAVLLISCAVPATLAGTLSVRADIWPPYNDDPKSLKPGYMIQVLWEIYKKQGDTIDYQPLSWTDSLAAVRKGQFDAVIGATKDDAPDFVFPQEIFGLSDTAFFARKGTTWKYTGPASLEKLRLGVIESYSYNDELDDYIKANKGTKRIVEAQGDDPLTALVRMLQNGQIDAIAEDTNVMLNSLVASKVPLGSIVPVGKCAEISELYVAFSPNNPKSKELAARFDAGIRDLRGSGRLQFILKLYGLNDWKGH